MLLEGVCLGGRVAWVEHRIQGRVKLGLAVTACPLIYAFAGSSIPGINASIGGGPEGRAETAGKTEVVHSEAGDIG